jgi:hypothetical protein
VSVEVAEADEVAGAIFETEDGDFLIELVNEVLSGKQMDDLTALFAQQNGGTNGITGSPTAISPTLPRWSPGADGEACGACWSRASCTGRGTTGFALKKTLGAKDGRAFLLGQDRMVLPDAGHWFAIRSIFSVLSTTT